MRGDGVIHVDLQQQQQRGCHDVHKEPGAEPVDLLPHAQEPLLAKARVGRRCLRTSETAPRNERENQLIIYCLDELFHDLTSFQRVFPFNLWGIKILPVAPRSVPSFWSLPRSLWVSAHTAAAPLQSTNQDPCSWGTLPLCLSGTAQAPNKKSKKHKK